MKKNKSRLIMNTTTTYNTAKSAVAVVSLSPALLIAREVYNTCPAVACIITDLDIYYVFEHYLNYLKNNSHIYQTT